MGHDDGRALHRLHHVGHGKGLARAGYAQQRLVCEAGLYTIHQPGNGFRLVTGRFIRRGNAEYTL